MELNTGIGMKNKISENTVVYTSVTRAELNFSKMSHLIPATSLILASVEHYISGIGAGNFWYGFCLGKATRMITVVVLCILSPTLLSLL